MEKQHIVIIGCGRLGAQLANLFSEQRKDVLIVDAQAQSFRKLSPAYGGLTLEADATDVSTLKEIALREDTQLIVVTNNDNTNIMIAQMAKHLFHVRQVIARLYDPEHACVYEELDIQTICPVLLSVAEVERTLAMNAKSSNIKAL